MDQNNLDFDALNIAFTTVHAEPYALIKVEPVMATKLAELLGATVRRYYISDDSLTANAVRMGSPCEELVKMKIPDAGSVMSGDFGEILTAIFQATEFHPLPLLDPHKWRLKQDRTKPAPYSDVVQFLTPSWPEPSSEDVLVCSEVKSKATSGRFDPIHDALEDSRIDREGRLSKTLVWLRERAHFEELEGVTIEHLERFIDSVDYPPATRVFRAVAVICSSLVNDETAQLEVPSDEESALVIISVADLKATYTAVYDAVVASAQEKIPQS